jgi:hypothetical protein
MVAEFMEQPATVNRCDRRSAVWARADGPGSSESRGTLSGLEAGIRNLLSGDARGFIERQWQPYGE